MLGEDKINGHAANELFINYQKNEYERLLVYRSSTNKYGLKNNKINEGLHLTNKKSWNILVNKYSRM
jgi:hypothetical protein